MRWTAHLYSQRNINGILLTLGAATFALFTRNLTQFLWLLPLFYLAGAIPTPEPLSSPWVRSPRPLPRTPNALPRSLERLQKLPRLPHAARVRLESLHTLLYQLERSRTVLDGAGVSQGIKQAMYSFLPQTLENYTQLPVPYARLHPLQNGRTARFELLYHLDLLEANLLGMSKLARDGKVRALRLEGKVLEEICAYPLRFLH